MPIRVRAGLPWPRSRLTTFMTCHDHSTHVRRIKHVGVAQNYQPRGATCVPAQLRARITPQEAIRGTPKPYKLVNKPFNNLVISTIS